MSAPSPQSQSGTDTDQLPPHSLEAEEGVLGCILTEPAACLPDCVENRVAADWFYHLPLRQLYVVLHEMHGNSLPIDLVTLVQKLRDTNQLDAVGGVENLTSLPDKVPASTNLPQYVAILREKWLMRTLLKICSGAVASIKQKPDQFAETLSKTEESILALNSQRVAGKDVSWREVILGVIDRMEQYQRGGPQMLGLSTGYPYLDKMTCGLTPGQLVLISGRPGDGKTSLAMNIVEHIAVDGKVPVGVFSLEMTAEEIGARALFQRARADFQRFRTGYLLNEDVPKVFAAAKIGSAPIYLDDNDGSTIDDICAKARRWHREHDIRCLMVDYVAKVDTTEFFRDIRDKIAYISKRFKRLAKSLRIPVILLAQVNREGEKNGNRIPMLSDLAESDYLGRDADLVLMLYKVKIDLKDSDPDGEAAATLRILGKDWSNHYTRINALIAKQRNGPTGKCEFTFHKSSMRFLPFERNKPHSAAATDEQADAEAERARDFSIPSNEEMNL
jgi:replicative DNA helicase